MSLMPEADPNPLVTLFRRCVVRIDDDAGRFRGSGFFVAPGQVVTCAHVVHGAGAIRVRWQDRPAAPAVVASAVPSLASVRDPASYPLPDLALLALGDAEGWDHPCVALATTPPALDGSPAALFLAGYTVEHGPDPELTGATTEFETEVHADSHSLYKLKRGLLLHGYSGSPLLDRRAEAVAGIVESTRSRHVDLGGFAVPAAELVTAFPELAEANRVFHQDDDRWAAAAEAERTSAAARAGMRVRLGLWPAKVSLPPQDAVSAATLLRPRHAVVGYVGRQRLLADLAAWCERTPADGSDTELWFVTGGGGFGKTRLAIEACLEAEARGWTAGLLPPDDRLDQVTALAEWPGRLLIVVDYAETRAFLVGQLVSELAARFPRPAVRIVLLVRRRAARDDLRAMFNQQSEEHLGNLLRRAPLSRLDDTDSEVDRLELFRQGLAAFGARTGAAPRMVSPRLRAAHFARPLYVLTAAYLAQAATDVDVDELSEPGLLRALLTEHEAGHWDRWARLRQLALDPADQRTAVALATLLTATGDAEALTLARLIPHHGGEPETRLISIARWLARLYAASADQDGLVIAALEPDRLGEVLVGDVLRQYPDLLAAALDAASDRQLSRALTVVGRIAREEPVARDQLRAVLDRRLGDLFERGFGLEDAALLNAVITAMTISQPTEGAVEAAARFPETLPVRLGPIAATVTGLAVEGLRARVDRDPAAAPELALFLNDLANRLGQIGRSDEALATADEAIAIRRQLAETDPDTYLPHLAQALHTRAVFLSELGRREEALQAAEDGVAIRRRLAETDPDPGLSGLAMSLANLANFLGEAGRPDDALAAAEEAVAIRRQLARTDPDGELAESIASLGTLSRCLMGVGRGDEALELAGETVARYRPLAETSPGVYLPDLAMSLTNLAVALGTVGRWDETLDPTAEAVAIYGELADANPDAYLPRLAALLSNLASVLRTIGRGDEALDSAAEAVAIRRQLAETNPSARLPELAMSLINLANALGEIGREGEALTVTSEAVTIHRQLAETNPGAYRPELAMSLNNLAGFLSRVGRRTEAVQAADEAVAICRQLAETSPGAYLPRLATSLTSMANILRTARRPGEALDAASEAVARCEDLAEITPEGGLPYLAQSLSEMAICLSEAGQPDEAGAAADRAVTIRRQLAETNSGTYLPHLAQSLNDLAAFWREAGRGAEALATMAEAVTIRRQLAEASPVGYLRWLTQSLGNLANFLTEAGRADEAEQLFGDILGRFTDNPLGRGHILLARGTWCSTWDNLDGAVPDLAAALTAAEQADERVIRGGSRQLLRSLREHDRSAFDRAWARSGAPLPVWLEYPVTDDALADAIKGWLGTTDWPAFKTYLDDHATTLLTGQAEAALEHLVDVNPDGEALLDRLRLLQAARAYGTDVAFTAYLQHHLAAQLTGTLMEWIETRTWAASQAFAAAHTAELLHPLTLAVLDSLADSNPAEHMFRQHRGLLTYAAVAGFDAAYELRADADRRRTAFEAASTAPPAITRLALARMHSGLSADDAEAHFQLAATALLAGKVHEAAAALADCADHAAPFERRDFSRRLAELIDDMPGLAPVADGLQQVLSPGEDVSGS
jgi:tetratricopeptide (TPR) repeat protein